MRAPHTHDGGRTVVLIGEEPMLASYLADIRMRGAEVVFASQMDELTSGYDGAASGERPCTFLLLWSATEI